jgi:hypothetical protein
MKETMDGAAKDAERVAKQYLPERPHHHSLRAQARTAVDIATGPAAAAEGDR